MEASALFVISSLRGVAAAVIGTVYQNRFHQAEKDSMDLSVEDTSNDVIERGVHASIEIGLKAAVSTYKEKWRKEV